MLTLRRLLFAALVIAGAGAAMLYWLRGPLVETVAVFRGDIAAVAYATGTVEPTTWAKVMPIMRARLVEHCDCEGRLVKKGDILARLDDKAARAELAQAEARREFAQSEMQRQHDLTARGATTRQAFERAEADLRQLDGQISALKARLTDYLLVAPADGEVLRADGHVGDVPGTGDVLFWVGQPSPKQVVADVNEEDIARVAVGQTALLRNNGFPDGGLSATVASITPKGDPTTKTFRANLSLPDTSPLKIGMTVEANIVTQEHKSVLLVPAEALRARPGADPLVFVADGGRLRGVPVKVGLRGGRYVEVTGVNEGEAVVAVMRAEYREGESVRAAPKARP